MNLFRRHLKISIPRSSTFQYLYRKGCGRNCGKFLENAGYDIYVEVRGSLENSRMLKEKLCLSHVDYTILYIEALSKGTGGTKSIQEYRLKGR